MKSHRAIYLIIGIALGAFGSQLPSWKKAPLTEPEEALTSLLYEELQKFPNQWEASHIATTLNELAQKKRAPLDKSKRDQILLDLVTIEAERKAQENLALAEAYLASLRQNKELKQLYEGKLCIEIVTPGKEGPKVTAQDQVLMSFKQFDLDGRVIKDTEDKPFVIPISRMIKGFQLGIEGAKVGEIRKIYIHPDLGFGKIGRGDHANQLLIYELQVLGIDDSV